MNATDHRITTMRRRARSRPIRRPGRSAIAATLLLPGLALILAGIALYTPALALILAGVALVVAAAGYIRGS